MMPKPVLLWPDPATIIEQFRGVFFAHWEELLRLRRVAIRTSGQDDIHDLRVASRRFRAALELFYPFTPKGQKTELRKSIRGLTRILGGLRNIDEALIFFQSRARVDASADKKFIFTLSEMRARELKLIDKALIAFDHTQLDRIVREMVAGLNEDSIRKRNGTSLLAYFSDVSIRQYLPIHRLLAGSTSPEHRLARHALRIAIKKWRYFFEIISQVLDRDYTHIQDLLKEYQTLLGQMNDIAVFRVLISKLKLPSKERKYVKSILLSEDVLLLEKFTTLIERKPLVYTFLM
ncbi:MAG: CHAD domain-containing protein [Geobacteraceae bacterium]|nr:CHAD domain-containing protein [Geobacteraceae bacterium]NTW81345.1 CHAD domain-containing protein [Geobacteraceae bacterium]